VSQPGTPVTAATTLMPPMACPKAPLVEEPLGRGLLPPPKAVSRGWARGQQLKGPLPPTRGCRTRTPGGLVKTYLTGPTFTASDSVGLLTSSPNPVATGPGAHSENHQPVEQICKLGRHVAGGRVLLRVERAFA